MREEIVLALDVTGSMCSPCSKIDAAKVAAKDLIVTIVGKTWDLHVREDLRIPLEQNLEVLHDSIAFLAKRVDEVILDEALSSVDAENEAVIQQAAGALVVSTPLAQAGVDSPKMVYLLRPHEVSAYATHQWADTPARLLVPLLVQALERTGVWRVVVPAPTAVRAEYRLDSELLALEQQFFGQPSRVRLALRARLVESKTQRVLGARGFEVVEEAPSDDADGGVVAATRAAEKLLDALAGWAAGCVGRQQGTGCE